MHTSKDLGHYNLASSDKQWCVQIAQLPKDAPHRCLSETWPEDEEPDTSEMWPSALVEVIAERVESYWISTRRAEQRETIEWIRANAARLDLEWAEREVRLAERRVESAQIDLERARDFRSDCEEAVAEAASASA